MKRKVAIIGGLAKYENVTKLLDGTWEVWGMNAIRPLWGFKWARMFNLHRIAHLKRDWAGPLWAERQWAEEHPKVPFYVVDRWPRGWLPNQVIFPRDKLTRQPHSDYHAGSFDWLVAFAIYLKAAEISLHGVGLTLESGEPIAARACLEYWCGYAEGCGIKVTAAKDCDMFLQFHLVKSRTVYGWDDVKLVEDRT